MRTGRSRESGVRFFPASVSAILIGIALYFALLWGLDASRILTSPVYGLDNAAFAQLVYRIGGFIHVGPNGIILVAAFFGAAKLAIASILLCHLVERIRAFGSSKADHETLEAGLLLVVAMTIVSALPALADGIPSLVWPHSLHLVLAGVAATLSVLERIAERWEAAALREAARAAAEDSSDDATPAAPAQKRASEDWNLLPKAASSAAV
jgi:hypothetical protein